MKTLVFILFLTTATSFGADGDLLLSTADDLVTIKAPDAAILQSHWRWLDERYAEASAIKAGSTYAELAKHFVVDGGLHAGGASWRFTHNLAQRLKRDVTFEGNLDLGKPDPSLKIKSVSQLYVGQVTID